MWRAGSGGLRTQANVGQEGDGETGALSLLLDNSLIPL